jgi:hypothetical protein
MTQRKINFVVRVAALDADSFKTLGQTRKMYTDDEIRFSRFPENTLGSDVLKMIKKLKEEVADGPENT